MTLIGYDIHSAQSAEVITSETALPKSAAAEACRYTLAIWKRLVCFLDHPELELNRNLAENSTRPIAVGLWK